METLKGFIYLETCGGIENWCLAVEDPGSSLKTRIIKCKGRKVPKSEYGERKFNKKKGGSWKFRAFRFKDNVENIEIIEKSISEIWPDLSTDTYHQIPITELKKLKEWTD